MARAGTGVAAALLAAALGLAGCVHYDVDVRVGKDGDVRVRERVAVDQEWKEMVQDTLQASETLISGYVKEAVKRGGRVVWSTADSALVEFRYRSLAVFARDWPDPGDEGQRFDRSIYRRRQEGGRAVDELILFRQSPPDRSRQAPDQRYPVLTFWVTPPRPAVLQNAHAIRGDSYLWRFTEKMTAPDSVWIAWPAGS